MAINLLSPKNRAVLHDLLTLFVLPGHSDAPATPPTFGRLSNVISLFTTVPMILAEDRVALHGNPRIERGID